jgi:hypothetical protein
MHCLMKKNNYLFYIVLYIMDVISNIKTFGISLMIAVFYNMFFHKLGNVLYNDLEFQQRKENTISVIFIAGIIGLSIGYLLCLDDFEYQSLSVGHGLQIGGVFLLVSSLLNNWTEMDDGLKLIMLGIMMSGSIYYFY